MRFSIRQNPLRRNVYPELIEHLEADLGEINGEIIRYQIGGEGNIIKILPANGGRADLVLLSELEFDRQEN